MKQLHFSFNLRLRQGIIAFIVVYLALHYRRPDAFSRPQFWGEDGAIFFEQVTNMGVRSLVTTYAGYLHMVPRLLAGAFSLLRVDFSYVPACYNYSSFIITWFIVLQLLRSAEFLRVPGRWVYATFFLFLPGACDLFMNITNLNWLLALFMVQYLFVRPPAKNALNYAMDLVVLALCGLSGPISVVLAPLAFAIMVVERKELNLRKALPMLVVVMCGAVQLYCIKYVEPSFTRTSTTLPEPFHLYKLVTNNMMEYLFLHDGRLSFIPVVVLEGISFTVFLIFLFYFIIKYKSVFQPRKYILLWAAILMMAIFIKVFWPNESRILALQTTRYYFVTFICVGWLLLLARNRRLNLLQLGVMLYFFVAYSDYSLLQLVDRQWGRQVEEYKQGKRQELEIDPEGWRVMLEKPYKR